MSASEDRSKRAQRLIDLYALRGRVATEIAAIEAEIASEAALVRREAELAEAEKRKERRRRPAACGTDGGYHHHLRVKKEPACNACRMAHSAAERERVSRKVAS